MRPVDPGGGLGQREIPAQVPGSVLHDLLENGLIPDPFQGENEYDARDLFDRDYAYTRSFQLSAASWPGSM